ncbi:YeeE/YedE family protein [Avibacterium sp. 21-594]|uniref:YeeE/YedE family protein n=1 Tax=Avibacterium sp. 21-594 TaxID=2911535 RepID=UPI0022465FBC|nr:YeeE/YedE family protein [Avibacterium sp. 21-594]MCW9715739.1 YeeE/YedE family protein [Avibacterium sp. 21-594]
MVWTIISGGVLGVIFGFVLQRTRFCMTGGFRDMYTAKNNKMFYAFLLAILIQSVGVLTLVELGYISSPYEDFSLVGTVFGSYLFGIGIVLASGCATGTWYRAGEGLIGSWLALAMYMLSAAMMKYGVLVEFKNTVTSYTRMNDNLAAQLGISVWWLVALLSIAVGFGISRTLSKHPKNKVATLPQKYQGLRHWLFEKRYHPFVAALAIGIIALVAWPASESTGRAGGLGITTPSANLIHFLVTGDEKRLNWGVFLVIGIFIGSYLAAKGSREFRWRLPDTKTLYHSVVGGFAMGVGASLAGGCTIGNGLTATAVMSSKGWIALAFTILGVWTMAHVLFIRPRRLALANTAA